MSTSSGKASGKACAIGDDAARVNFLEAGLRRLGFELVDWGSYKGREREALELADVVIFLPPVNASFVQPGANSCARDWIEAALRVSERRPVGQYAVIVVDQRACDAMTAFAQAVEASTELPKLDPVLSTVGLLGRDRDVIENLRGWRAK